jgi:hypothetical protein
VNTVSTVVVAACVLGAFLVGLAVGWLRCRRARVRLDALTHRHELAVARLRGELGASVSHGTRAQAEAESARLAVAGALRENGRLTERLAELRAGTVRLDVHGRVLEERAALVARLDAARQELSALRAQLDELDHHRAYIETLQRELLYRDERMLELAERGPARQSALRRTIDPARSSIGRGRPPGNGGPPAGGGAQLGSGGAQPGRGGMVGSSNQPAKNASSGRPEADDASATKSAVDADRSR